MILSLLSNIYPYTFALMFLFCLTGKGSLSQNATAQLCYNKDVKLKNYLVFFNCTTHIVTICITSVSAVNKDYNKAI